MDVTQEIPPGSYIPKVAQEANQLRRASQQGDCETWWRLLHVHTYPKTFRNQGVHISIKSCSLSVPTAPFVGSFLRVWFLKVRMLARSSFLIALPLRNQYPQLIMMNGKQRTMYLGWVGWGLGTWGAVARSALVACISCLVGWVEGWNRKVSEVGQIESLTGDAQEPKIWLLDTRWRFYY